ncbi:MAG: hypothetical protein U1B79_01235 [Candidatus Pacearchaeota archaeon]|nr:hypothetical protein [Candidatus Pacearchaeota archaeon]
MGLFSKKEKKSEEGIPALPRLPRLPDFPEMDERDDRTIHQLPSFPSNSFGKKFSRDSIKDAVSGERGEEDFYADELSGDEIRMMREPLRRPMTEEMEEEMEMPERTGMMGGFRQEAEPVFVRIDRFEEGLKMFDGIKNQMSEIERILAETKRLKEKEEAELHSWENELKRMKSEIEKIGRDIFSKV